MPFLEIQCKFPEGCALHSPYSRDKSEIPHWIRFDPRVTNGRMDTEEGGSESDHYATGSGRGRLVISVRALQSECEL